MNAIIKNKTLLIPKTPTNCMLLIEFIEEIQSALPKFKVVTNTDNADVMHCRIYIDGNPITGNLVQKAADYINLNSGFEYS
jgi:hypothetical protein